MTLSQDLSEKLKSISQAISPTDKNLAEKKVKISRPTLDKYLNGDVSKVDIALKILQHFTPIVRERIKDAKKVENGLMG